MFFLVLILLSIGVNLANTDKLEPKGKYFNWDSVSDSELSKLLMEEEMEEIQAMDPSNFGNMGGSRGDMGWAIIKPEFLEKKDITQYAKEWEVMMRTNAIDVKCFGIEGNKVMFVAEFTKKDMKRVAKFIETRNDVQEFDWSGNRPGYIDPDSIKLPPGFGGPSEAKKKKKKSKKKSKKSSG